MWVKVGSWVRMNGAGDEAAKRQRGGEGRPRGVAMDATVHSSTKWRCSDSRGLCWGVTVWIVRWDEVVEEEEERKKDEIRRVAERRQDKTRRDKTAPLQSVGQA